MVGSNNTQALHWRVNCFCNRKCPFCYGPEGKNEVALEKSLPVVDALIDYGIDTFILTGGEPLLSAHIDDLMAHVSGRGAKIVLYTNCDFFDFHEKAISKYVDTLCVPVDGGSEYVHDLVRGKHNLRAVVSVLDRYANSRSNIKIKVGTVVGRHNLHELRAILYLLDKYKIDVWKLYEYLRYSDRDLQKLWASQQYGITESEYGAAARSILDVQPRKTNISISSEFDRESSYFMMNPDLEIIVPTRGSDGIFVDIPICNAMDTPPSEIEALWMSKVDWNSYKKNLSASHF